MIVTATRLAELFEVNAMTVSRWIAEGMPAGPEPKPGKPRRIPSGPAIRWFIERAVGQDCAPDGGESAQSAKRRHAVALADLAEIRLAQESNSVVPAAEVDQMLLGLQQTIAAHLDALPEALACRLAGEDSAAACRQIIVDEARRMRQRLADAFEGQADAEEQPE